MIKTIRNPEETLQRQIGPKHPLRLTALLYLKEALLKEQYENCQELVALALEFGASPPDVEKLLEDPRRNPT